MAEAADIDPPTHAVYTAALLKKAHPEHGGHLVVHQTKANVFRREGFKDMAGCVRGPFIALYGNPSAKRATAFIPLRDDTRVTLMTNKPGGRDFGFRVVTRTDEYELFAANANAARRWVIGTLSSPQHAVHDWHPHG